jgi:hypothetical protein
LIPLFPLEPTQGQGRKHKPGKHIVYDHQGGGCYGDPDSAGARLIPVHSDGASDQEKRQTVNENQHWVTE